MPGIHPGHRACHCSCLLNSEAFDQAGKEGSVISVAASRCINGIGEKEGGLVEGKAVLRANPASMDASVTTAISGPLLEASLQTWTVQPLLYIFSKIPCHNANIG